MIVKRVVLKPMGIARSASRFTSDPPQRALELPVKVTAMYA